MHSKGNGTFEGGGSINAVGYAYDFVGVCFSPNMLTYMPYIWKAFCLFYMFMSIAFQQSKIKESDMIRCK